MQPLRSPESLGMTVHFGTRLVSANNAAVPSQLISIVWRKPTLRQVCNSNHKIRRGYENSEFDRTVDDGLCIRDDEPRTVRERSRDPKTYEVHYPVKRTLPGGETDPAGMEIDLWMRSKEQNTANFPPHETFVHLCWEEVTWR